MPTVGPGGVVSNRTGTSFAAPQVSAAAAVIFSKHSNVALHGQCVLLHLKNTARSAHGGLPMVDAYVAWAIDLPWSEHWCMMPREM